MTILTPSKRLLGYDRSHWRESVEEVRRVPSISSGAGRSVAEKGFSNSPKVRKFCRTTRTWRFLGLVLCCGTLWGALIAVSAHAQSGLTISQVSDNRGSYPGSQVPRYEKLEIDFQVDNTVATNLQHSYDAAPPAGIEPGLGITVNAQFTPDNWQTLYTQPAFYYEDYQEDVRGGHQWFYPTGQYSWKVRFAPHVEGNWQYRLIATDAGGTTQTGVYSFTVAASSNRGFIRVGRHDPRYFEFEDGTYFPGLGYNMNYDHVSWSDPVLGNQANFQIMRDDGIQLIRVWLSEWGIYGSSWNPWNAQEDTFQGRYIPYEGITFSVAYPGSDVSMIVSAGNPSLSSCMFIGWEKARPAVKRNTNYRVRVRFREDALTGPRVAGSPFGFVVKHGGWLGNTCADPGVGTVVAATYPGDWQTFPDSEPGWQILEGTLNTGNNDYLPLFYLIVENATGGKVNVDYVWVQEELGSGLYGANVISKPWMAHHQYFEQRNSFAFDKVLELAEENGVYLRPVVLEKNEWIMNHIGSDGQFTWTESNNNFYGDWRNSTKTRWLQEQWWRYLQARWGYSTNIQSWELLNEGDPNSSRHYAQADEFGKYMHQFAPDDHLVSTSMWHSFPRSAFWANGNYPDVDFADVHLYVPRDANYSLQVDGSSFTIGTAADYADTAAATHNVSELIGALTARGAGKPVIRGETGFVVSGSEPADPQILNDHDGVWLHNYVWGQISPGGLLESYWYDTGHIYGRNGDGVDLRPQFKAYYDFIHDIPLNNGFYRDAGATSTNSLLRVWGQIDVQDGRAHLWIQNREHTWRNALAGTVSAASGSITLPGLNPSTNYPVEWWDTSSGSPVRTESVSTDSGGNLVLDVSNLSTDIAVRVGDYSGRPLPPTNLRVTVQP